MFIGAVLGLSARLIISSLQIAGSVIAQQLGLGFVTAVDPTHGQQGVLVGNFLAMLGVTLIFATDLHHLVIAALDDSYKLFAPGEIPLLGDVAALTTRTVATAFRIGIQLSAPFLVFGLLFNLGLGILSRLMPQMQVFFVGLPLSILLGLLILMLVLGAMMTVFLGGGRERAHRARSASHDPSEERRTWLTKRTTAKNRLDPSQKRLQEAQERGDVVKSQEVGTWFVMAGATLILLAFSGTATSGILTTLRGLIANSYDIRVDGPGFIAVLAKLGGEVVGATALPLSLLALAALVGSVIQHRPVWSAEGLTPKFSKISPAAGLGRLSSKQTLANFAKGLTKLGVFGTVIGALLWPERFRLEGLVTVDPAAILAFTHVAGDQDARHRGGDARGGRRRWITCSNTGNGSSARRCRCAELKEEFKQTDGDPAVKGKIRQIRQNRMRKRMMAAVPKASVVITNPTHFAVALQYERGMNAPICVAKGADLIARKIREVASEHGIPIVENPPLARAIHASVEIDQEIPPEHYKAVAEVIGYVMRLNRTFGGKR